jgi:hypothetical protein
MKARRILIGALWLNFLAVTATAETIVIRPDPCPVAADAPKIIDFEDIEAADLNLDRVAASGVVVLYPVRGDGWASARLLARFELDGEARARTRRIGCAPARRLFVR